MTPFDAVALLAMLVTFYPTVTQATLVRARRERPEYWAAGLLYGVEQYVLVLPDGAAWYLTSDGWHPGTQWRLAPKDLSLPDTPNPLALTRGPLAPVDETSWPVPLRRAAFEALVVDALGTLGAADAVLATAASRVAESADSATRMDGGGAELRDVTVAVDEIRRSRSADAFADIVGAADALAQTVDGVDLDYGDAPEAPHLPADPTPHKPEDPELPPPERPSA